MAHIEQNNLLPDGQHGSRAKRSALTQLMAHWDSILDGLTEGHGVNCNIPPIEVRARTAFPKDFLRAKPMANPEEKLFLPELQLVV